MSEYSFADPCGVTPLAWSKPTMRVVARTFANDAGLNPLRACAHAAGMRAPDVSMDEPDCIAENEEYAIREMLFLQCGNTSRSQVDQT